MKAIEQDVKLFKNSNHVGAVDSFIEKYLPIRMQAVVTETMRSVVSGKERRRLELYEHEKNTIMYRRMLMNVGAEELAKQMRELHIRATQALIQEEKDIKRKIDISSAVSSQVLTPNTNMEARTPARHPDI